jgi:hypothetical protein
MAEVVGIFRNIKINCYWPKGERSWDRLATFVVIDILDPIDRRLAFSSIPSELPQPEF